MSFDAEVIVAGAGPAGAVAARTLAAGGVDTLLIDRAGFPRNKPCGGGLTARALKRFNWLASVVNGIDVQPINVLDLESPDNTALRLEGKDPVGLLVRRLEFDDALVREAQLQGATLREGFEVTQAHCTADGVTIKSRSGDVLSAPTLISADGVHSVIAKRLGVNRAWPTESMAIDMMEETPNAVLRSSEPNTAWVSYGYNGLDGYAYIFPKVQHVNVGLGCLLSHFKSQILATPYQMQSSLVSLLEKSGKLIGKSDRSCFMPFLIPVGGPLPTAHHGRVLFVGDAGGFVNGFTAEGIYYAMISGELAARAVRQTTGRRESAGRVYDRLWQREIGSELRDSVLVQRYLLSDHKRINRAVRAGKELRWLAAAIVDYATGARSYGRIRTQVFLRAPVAALRLAVRSLSTPKGGVA